MLPCGLGEHVADSGVVAGSDSDDVAGVAETADDAGAVETADGVGAAVAVRRDAEAAAS